MFDGKNEKTERAWHNWWKKYRQKRLTAIVINPSKWCFEHLEKLKYPKKHIFCLLAVFTIDLKFFQKNSQYDSHDIVKGTFLSLNFRQKHNEFFKCCLNESFLNWFINLLLLCQKMVKHAWKSLLQNVFDIVAGWKKHYVCWVFN